MNEKTQMSEPVDTMPGMPPINDYPPTNEPDRLPAWATEPEQNEWAESRTQYGLRVTLMIAGLLALVAAAIASMLFITLDSTHPQQISTPAAATIITTPPPGASEPTALPVVPDATHTDPDTAFAAAMQQIGIAGTHPDSMIKIEDGDCAYLAGHTRTETITWLQSFAISDGTHETPAQATAEVAAAIKYHCPDYANN
jgi:Protein of unknown function (DUF732)